MPRAMRLTGRVQLRAAEADRRGRRFRMTAYSGEVIGQAWSDVGVVIDLDTLRLPATLPVLYDHRQEADWVAGRAESLRIESGRLVAEGPVYPTTEGGKKVLLLAQEGHEWQASVGGDVGSLEHVEAGRTVHVNGREYAGPVAVARDVDLREISFVVIGAAKNTSAIVADRRHGMKKRIRAAAMSFEDWLLSLGFDDPSALDDVQRANLQRMYDEKYGGDDAPDGGGGGDPVASSRRGGRVTLEAVQGALILRAGGRLDHPAYQTPAALAMRLPSWLRLNVNHDRRQRAMEAAHYLARESLVDVCRMSLEVSGRHVPRNRGEMILAAFSGGALNDIFTTNVNARLLETYAEAPDSTKGWTQETEALDFKTIERVRLTKGAGLSKLPRGGEADHESRSDVKESYRIARYAKQFAVDEQDVLDDHLGALADAPVEFGYAAARLRADLVYGILKANAALDADGVALFHASHANTDTSAALAADKLRAGVSTMRVQRENSVNLNIEPTHLVVPAALEFLARELAQSTVLIIAGTAGTITERGDLNTLRSVGLDVVADARLDNGFTDPSSGTAYGGDTNDWFLASSRGHTIEVAYLAGTGKAPQTRSYALDRGRWGIGWDVCLDIGAKAIDYKALYRGQG